MKPASFTLAFLLSACLAPLGAQSIGGCPTFPANNIWNTPVDTLPVSPNSAAYINSAGPATGLHADFGSGLWEGGPIGIPYVIVNGAQPKKTVVFDYDDESDPGPYPVPDNPPIEGGPNSEGDRHILIVDSTNCVLYELYSAYPRQNGSWQAGSGAIYALTGNQLRPRGWTSADAAGLPILPGLVRYDEALSGEIRHAIRFTVRTTQRAYVWPARHYASSNTSPSVPPMGQRFRLRAGFDVSGFPPLVQTILNAMKKYGVILADNGSNWFISGAPDDRWDNDDLATMRSVKGADFEAVDVSSLMMDQDSAEAIAPDGATLSGFTISPSSVSGGAGATGLVTLGGPAPAGGAVVALSSNSSAATPPPSVTIPAGSTSASFSIATTALAAVTQATLSAVYAGSTRTATLQVNPAPPSLTVTLMSNTVTGGVRVIARVKLGATPASSVVITLASSNAAAASTPASVTIPGGATSTTFVIRTAPVASATGVAISASLAGATGSATLRVLPATLRAVWMPGSVRVGSANTGRVSLTGVTTGARTISLASSNPAALSVPAAVIVPAGANSAPFQLQAGTVLATVQITATHNGVTVSGSIAVRKAGVPPRNLTIR
jgi:hypothetical protein